jgi:hypothetical protein
MESSLTAFNAEFNLDKKNTLKAMEFNKICLLTYAKLDPSLSKKDFYCDLSNTTRFLIARDYNNDKALEMWKKWYDWRISYKVDEIVEEEIANELKTGKAFWFGVDKNKRPCLIIKIRRHKPKAVPIEETVRFAVSILERGTQLMKEHGVYKIVVIWDRNGFSRKNFDTGMFTLIKQIIGIMQDFYAERLAAVYILHSNWFFKTIMAAIKPFLADKTKDKIKIMGKPTDLVQHFEKDQLLPEYGGSAKFQYRYPADAKPVTDDDVVNDDGGENDKPDADFEKMVDKLAQDGK